MLGWEPELRQCKLCIAVRELITGSACSMYIFIVISCRIPSYVDFQQSPETADMNKGQNSFQVYEIRDAFIASVEVTRCVCRTPISTFLHHQRASHLSPVKGEPQAG